MHVPEVCVQEVGSPTVPAAASRADDARAGSNPKVRLADHSPTDPQPRVRYVIYEMGRKECIDPNGLASNRPRRKCYASCCRSRCEQFVAGQSRSATSARTESSTREDACKRHLLHRRASNARTLARTIPPN